MTVPQSFLVFHDTDTFDEDCLVLLFALCLLMIRIDVVEIDTTENVLCFLTLD